MAGEPGANVEQEGDAVRAAGLRYIHLPTTVAATITPAAIDPFLAAVKDPANLPMLFHCTGGSRGAALWAVKRAVVDGWTKERALAEAETIGLTNTVLKKALEEYLTKK
jgi:uncharacterized protein (TIGR01244 family)